MRTYGVSMIPSNDSIVPVLMPFYTAEPQNFLERGSRPYSVVEILREVFKEDFSKAIQGYMDSCRERVAAAIGVENACHFRLIWLSEPKVESSLKQPACTTAVDLVFKASVETMVSMDGNETDGIMEMKRYQIGFRMRYLIQLWSKQCSAPMIAPTGKDCPFLGGISVK